MSRYFLCIGLTLAFLSPAMALDVNQASEAELDGLRGIGPPFTRRLMAARAQHPFKDWSDLMQRVSGMGPRVAQSLSDQGLTVQGLPLPSSLSAKKSPTP
jgi:competence protein ComEA